MPNKKSKGQQPKSKRQPERMCLVCRGRFAKRDLLRVVYTEEEGVRLDHSQRAPGRGAYVCCQEPCVEALLKGRRLQQQLKLSGEVAGLAQVAAELRAAVQARAAEEAEQARRLARDAALANAEPVLDAKGHKVRRLPKPLP